MTSKIPAFENTTEKKINETKNFSRFTGTPNADSIFRGRRPEQDASQNKCDEKLCQ